ncbi:AcfA family outer membrane beta-barrel protein [Photobacterium damselae]|uniref:AcfA family outer membrane beta-barrel protein n=1 Tax=Photobacterium damselae TaxID=38293 RepID=UPI0030F3D76D
MKKILFFPLFFLVPHAISASYIGLEYGLSSFSHDYSTSFSNPDRELAPDSSTSTWGVKSGYRWERWEQWGVEIGYRQIRGLKDSDHVWMGNNQGYKHNIVWNSKLDINQVILKPIYYYNLSEKFDLKTSVGLVYSMYDYSSSSYDEYDNHHIYEVKRSEKNHSSEELGAIVSIGVDYELTNKFLFGFAIEHYIDNKVSGSNVLMTTSYIIN